MGTLFGDMDKPALDAAYDNGAAVAGSAACMDDFRQRSAQLYAQAPCQRDLSYGRATRQRFDWFPGPTATAPLLIFIHGGYWQTRDKEDFAFVAAGPLAQGFSVILAEYTLAPAVGLSGIVNEIGQLLDFVTNEAKFGGAYAAQQRYLAGHSAGAHLAALYRAYPGIHGVLAISGIYDLEPIRLSYINDKLALTAEEAHACSPAHAIAAGTPTVIAVGAAELPELIRQSRDYAQACMAAGQEASFDLLDDRNHYTVLEELAAAGGALTTALRRLSS